MRKPMIFIIILIIIGIGIAGFVYIPQKTRTTPPIVPPQRISVTGTWECLPHTDTTGPQTEECALGVAIDQSDAHYALNLMLTSVYPVDFQTGTHVRIEGVLTPPSQIPSGQWKNYPIDGIINATSIQKL